MKLLKVGPRQVINLDSRERLVAIGFDKDQMKPFMVISGLGVQLVDLTFDELVKKLEVFNKGEAV